MERRPTRRFRGRFAKPVDYTGFGGPAESPSPFFQENGSESASCGALRHARPARTAAGPPTTTILSRMLRKFWLLFAQACTLCLAALFVVVTLRPDLLPRAGGRFESVIVTQETATSVSGARVTSYADAAKKAMPAVVNLYTSKEVRTRNPLAEDPLFRRYFPELDRGTARRQTSLGSGVIVSPEGYVLTNHHVIEGADDIQLVLADGRRVSARVRGTDPESDLAVLKADADEPAGDDVRRFGQRAGRRRRARDRQSVRPRQHGDARAS